METTHDNAKYVIWKDIIYVGHGKVTHLRLPVHSQIIGIDKQYKNDEFLIVWFKFQYGYRELLETRTFKTFHTGTLFEGDGIKRHLKTVVMEPDYIIHVFEME